MEEQKTYKKGDTVSESGLYECKTCTELKKSVRQRFKEGDQFSECSECNDKTEWKKSSSDLDMGSGCRC